MTADKYSRISDRRRAAFDKLRLRCFLRAMKVSPHPELVEGRTVFMPRSKHLRSSVFICGFNPS
jgi:hypothetical protein